MVLLVDVVNTDKTLEVEIIEMQEEEIIEAAEGIIAAAAEETIVVGMAAEEIITIVILRKGIRKRLRGLMCSIRSKGWNPIPINSTLFYNKTS